MRPSPMRDRVPIGYALDRPLRLFYAETVASEDERTKRRAPSGPRYRALRRALRRQAARSASNVARASR